MRAYSRQYHVPVLCFETESDLSVFSACIHLHRKFAIPQVDFDLSVCGIKPLSMLMTSSPPDPGCTSDFHSTPSTSSPRPSISKIISCSRLLFSLLRSSHQSTLLSSLDATPSITATSAVFSGPVIRTENILLQSPFCGCSQVVAGFGAALAVATAGTRWQALAAQSDFELAKTTLGRVKRLWPVAR